MNRYIGDTKPVFTWDTAEHWADTPAVIRSARTTWMLASIDPKFTRYVYRMEFRELGDKKTVTVFRFAENSEGSRFITPCPNGEHHAAKLMPQQVEIDEFPPTDLWYPSASEG